MTSLQFNHPTSLLIPYKADFFSLFSSFLFVGYLPYLSICPSLHFVSLLPSFHTFLNYFFGLHMCAYFYTVKSYSLPYSTVGSQLNKYLVMPKGPLPSPHHHHLHLPLPASGMRFSGIRYKVDSINVCTMQVDGLLSSSPSKWRISWILAFVNLFAFLDLVLHPATCLYLVWQKSP